MKKLFSHIICISFLLGAYAQSGDIHTVQYYFDTDPGVGQVGNGGIIDLTSPTTDLDQSFNWTLPPELGAGFHYLYVRARSSDNTWSLHEDALFYVYDPDVFGTNDDPADIAGMEYFLDEDPGVGNGIAIALNTTPTSGLSESVTLGLPADIPFGFHYLYVRARSSDNTWSLHEDALFYVFDPDVFGPDDDPADIAAMEYFLDDDPGVGNGTAIPLNTTPTSGLSESVTMALPSDIPFGFHRLYVRAKSSDNTWSLHEDGLFYVFDPDLFGPQDDPAEIVELEYYYDEDPGPGEGHRIPITSTSSLNMTVPIEAPCLEPGEHYLYVRARDSEGNWSLFESDTLDLQPEVTPAVISPAGPLFLCDGETLLLTVPETVELAYQWTKDGVDISNETGNTLLIDSEGDYAIRSTCLGESALSDPVSVILVIPDVPTITPDGPTTFCAGSDVTLTSSASVSYLWSTGATTQSITVSTSNDYSVTTTDEYGCSAISLATTVVRNPNPAVPAISADGPLAFCDGADAVLTSSSAAGYLWSTGATTQSITVSSSDSYSVTVTNANGCSRTSEATVVTVYSLPATPTISADGPTTFCDGESVTLTSSAEDNYLWSTGATSQSILVTASDSYSVTVTTADGCSANSSSISVTVQSNSTWFADTDEDGYGDSENTTQYCVQPTGFVANSLDCDDTDEFINPDSEEVCDNAEDDNCDGEIDENCLDCSVFDTAPVDLTKSFDPVNGIQDRVQVKWFKESPEVRYTVEDNAACDIEYWAYRYRDAPEDAWINIPVTERDTSSLPYTTVKKNNNKPLFKWPLKFRLNNGNNQVLPNRGYRWRVRCYCEQGALVDGAQVITPWSEVKFFNTPDFDPSTGIYTPPPGVFSENELKRNTASEIKLMPNPANESLRIWNEDGLPESFEWYIMDMTGRLISSGSVRANKIDYLQLDLQEMAQGSYQIMLIDEAFSSSASFLIRR